MKDIPVWMPLVLLAVLAIPVYTNRRWLYPNAMRFNRLWRYHLMSVITGWLIGVQLLVVVSHFVPLEYKAVVIAPFLIGGWAFVLAATRLRNPYVTTLETSHV